MFHAVSHHFASGLIRDSTDIAITAFIDHVGLKATSSEGEYRHNHLLTVKIAAPALAFIVTACSTPAKQRKSYPWSEMNPQRSHLYIFPYRQQFRYED